MIKLILLILFYILFPVVLIRLTAKYSMLNKIGAIVLAYMIGILIGNIGILPKGSDGFHQALNGRSYIPKSELVELSASGTITEKDLYANKIAALQDAVLTVIIPLSIPLLLFSLNIRRWLKFAGKGFLSMVLAVISVMVIVGSGYFFFRNNVPECNKIAGMLIGVYTGGTPNMAALSVALHVNPAAFIMTNTYDMIVGALTLIFFITLGPKLFRYILPSYYVHNDKITDEYAEEGLEAAEEFDDYSGMLKRGIALPLLGALGISVLIFAIGGGVSFLLPGVPKMVSVILTITTLGIAASFIPRVNKIKKTFQLGMYLIIAFSLVVSSMADLSVIFQVKYLNLFLYVTYAYFGSLALHLLLSWIFRVDADDYLITTTGFVYSPPFVPVVAAALKNKDVILTGLATGIIGYVIGNYLGVAFGMWLGYL